MLNGIERDLGSFSRVTANYLQPVHWNNTSSRRRGEQHHTYEYPFEWRGS